MPLVLGSLIPRRPQESPVASSVSVFFVFLAQIGGELGEIIRVKHIAFPALPRFVIPFPHLMQGSFHTLGVQTADIRVAGVPETVND